MINLVFLWCIVAKLYPVEDNKNRTSKYDMHEHTLCYGDLEFPMESQDIPQFENLNNLNINVLELTSSNIVYLRGGDKAYGPNFVFSSIIHDW